MTQAREQSFGVRYFTVGEDSAGQRIDNYLLKELRGVPKSVIYKALRKGEVRVDKKRAKPDYRLSQGESVRIPPVKVMPAEAPGIAAQGLKQRINSAILYEDEQLLVINKPAGLAVHGGSGVSLGLIEVLRQLRPEAKFLELVHRLDKDTSGCLMVAKKRQMLTRLHQFLRAGKAADSMEKRYLALACGRWNGKQHRVDAALEKFHLNSGERMVRVSREGKASLTIFKPIELFKQATLVEAFPVTGRTHQIRVHAQHMGHALAGDPKYTDESINDNFKSLGLSRLFLHALSIRVPGLLNEGKDFYVEAPLDEPLTRFLQRLRAET